MAGGHLVAEAAHGVRARTDEADARGRAGLGEVRVLGQQAIDCVAACVKVDDTIPGVEEGLNAGMWSIGLAVSGNEVGLSLEDWRALSSDEQHTRRERAYRRMLQSGAHYVVDTIADLLPCIKDIEARLRRGERP
jgi:phosphonoacetaldehyde hydrolase